MSTFAPYLDQDFTKLKDELLKSGQLFTDNKFPPEAGSLYKFNKQYNVKWKRAKEIFPNAEFIVDKIAPNDLDQGTLGDCWLISSFSAVAQIQEYINKVVPNDQSFGDDYCGMFHFRIWRNGYWIDVVVDDYLPVENDSLAFCKNEKDKNEMWGPLLEKAFAKVNACYEFIGNGGHPTDALVDLTGGVHETYELQDNKATNVKANIKKKALWDLLIKASSVKSLIGCSIDDLSGKTEQKKSNGLITGHAYSILGAYEVFNNAGKFDILAKLRGRSEPVQANSLKLLKIRNPWGRDKEWNGEFSDGSQSWNNISDNVKAELNVAEQDGNFFITLDDFLKNFHRVHFVHVNLSGLSQSEIEVQDSNEYQWVAKSFSGEWKKGVNSGGCGNDGIEAYWTNPQYNLSLNVDNTVDEKVSLIIDLMQCDLTKRRLTREKKEEAIAFTIYRIKDKDGIAKHRIEKAKKFLQDQLEEVGSYGTYMFLRQVCKRFSLPAGDYVIIPSCFHKDVEMKYLMRVFVEGNMANSLVVSNLNKTKCDIKPAKEPVEDVVVSPPKVPEDPNIKAPEEKPAIVEEKLVEEKNVTKMGEAPEVIGKEVEISDEKQKALEEEWKRLEEEWMKIVENKSEDDPYYVCPSKKEEMYESEEDDYKCDDEDGQDEDGEDKEEIYGTDSEFEYDGEQKQKKEEKKKNEKKRSGKHKNRGSFMIGDAKKIVNLAIDELEKTEAKSKACLIM